MTQGCCRTDQARPAHFGAPFFRVPVPAGMDMSEVALGTIDRGGMVVAIPRGDYWQCAEIIGKGGFAPIEARGIAAFRERIVEIVPGLAAGIDAVQSFDDVKLLSVALDRLTRWSRPGLLAIGDAAHAMSPVAGVGINLAVQDAVATANLLAGPLRRGAPDVETLRRVQQRRLWPTRATQRMQLALQREVIAEALDAKAPPDAPLAMRLLDAWPWARRLPARLIGMGVRPEHVAPELRAELRRG